MNHTTGMSTMTTGTPMAAHSRKLMSTPAMSRRNCMVRMFMDAPVGVAMPPMSTPMGRPIMMARAKLLPFAWHLFCSTTLRAMGASMTTTGTSAMKAERMVPPAMKHRSSREGLPPARREIHSATRSEKPERVKANVTQNMPKQKKTMGLAKLARALLKGAAPESG